jgi:hypothetical protein
LVYIGLIILVTVGIFFWLKKNKKSAETTSPLIPLLVGSISILFAGIPFWITGIPVQLEFPWDRSTLPFMVGASLLIAGSLLLFKPIFRNILASLLIALTIGMHYQNTVLYQAEWQKLNQFFWQLSWRAPSLEPGTIVISDKIPLFYYGDNNLTPVLNWTYSPDGKSRDLAYNFFDMGERLGKNLPDLKPDLPVSHGYRFVNFESTSSALLPVFYKEGSCLRIVDEQTSQISSIPKRLRAAAEFSKPENRILTDPQSKPPEFMPEPDHNWCYYYQKAELAAQQSDWNGVNRLYDQVNEKSLLPTDKTEWLPFIEAMAKTNKFDKAIDLTRSSLEQDGARSAVCGLWNRMSMDSSLEKGVSNNIGQSGCR